MQKDYISLLITWFSLNPISTVWLVCQFLITLRTQVISLSTENDLFCLVHRFHKFYFTSFQFMISLPPLLQPTARQCVMIGAYGQKTTHGQRPKGLGSPSRTILSGLKFPLGPSSYGFHHLPVMAWAKDQDFISTWTFEGHLSKHKSILHSVFPEWKNNAHAVARDVILHSNKSLVDKI